MKLLTGATGAAGSLIAKEFVQAREPVRILVRDRAKASWLEQIPTIQVVEGDLSKPDTLGQALEGVERVLLISGPTFQMVEAQATFIDAAKTAGVRHIVKFSGLDARPETRFPFGRMHKEIEDRLEASGLAWTHLRPTGFMQEYLPGTPA